MRHGRGWGAAASVVAWLAAGLASPPADAAQERPRAAQNRPATATAADVERLQDAVYDASRSVGRLQRTDPDLASRLRDELDQVAEDVVYLKVKFRREGVVSAADVADAKTRVEAVRARASRDGGLDDEMRGTTGDSPEPNDRTRPRDRETVPQTADRPGEVPAGAELDVRLQTSLNSGTARVEDPFTATTLVEMTEGDELVIPAGAVVRGVVASVDKAGRLDRTGRLTLRFDRLTIGHRTYPIRATVTEALEGEGYRGDAGKIGAGAGVGAIIGGILGGVKGALAGVLIGGGGVVAGTQGQDVDLPAGTVLRIRFEDRLQIR